MPIMNPLLGTAYAPNGNSSTHVLNVPAGTTTGQRMLAVLASANGVTTFAPSQTGWNEVYQDFDGSTGTSSGTKLAIYERTVSASEPATYTFTTQSRTVVGQIIVYPGSDGSIATIRAATKYGSATMTPTSPSVDPTPYTQARLLYLGVARGSAAGAAVVDRTPPAGMSERTDVEGASGGTVNTGFILADEQLSVSGATGTRQGGFASPGTRGFAVSLLIFPDDEDVNNDPVADAGPDQTTHVGELVTLDGSNSSDVEGIASYAWTQLTGPTVTLSGADTAITTFTPTEPGNYSFRLTITDTGSRTDWDDVNVTVYPAGVNVGTFVTGTSSTMTATPPPAAAVGDTAFMLVCHLPIATMTFPANWVPVMGAQSGTSSSHARINGMYKRLEASDLGVPLNVPLSANSRWVACIVTVSDLHPIHPALRSLGNAELTKPSIDGLVVNGTPGSTTYEYVATAINAAGETTASAPRTITTGPATLSAVNSINVWFNPVQGATNYRIYGRAAGGPYNLIATVDNTNITGVSTNQKRGIIDTGTPTTPQNPPPSYPSKVHWDSRDADDPGRLRNNFPGGFALHFTGLRAPTSTPGFALTSSPANTVILGQQLHPENQVLLAVLFEELQSAGNLLPGRLADFNVSTEAWAASSILLRPASANGTPTALAGLDRTDFGSSRVYLDASLAYDIDEDSLSYSWSQTAGPTVTLHEADTPTPWFIAPSTATSLTFQLTVTDPSNASDTDTTTITVIDPPSVVRVSKNGSFNTVQIKTYRNGEWI